jgi:hypothetical protein
LVFGASGVPGSLPTKRYTCEHSAAGAFWQLVMSVDGMSTSAMPLASELTVVARLPA